MKSTVRLKNMQSYTVFQILLKISKALPIFKELQLSIFSLSAIAALALFAVLSFSIPLWISSANSTTPSSPAAYSPSQNYGFQINWTEPYGSIANTAFQLGSPNGGLTNLQV